jgi:hypothetical protein
MALKNEHASDAFVKEAEKRRRRENRILIGILIGGFILGFTVMHYLH